MCARRRRAAFTILRWFDRRRPLTRIAILTAALVAIVIVSRGGWNDEHAVDDVEALARVIRSEVGTASHQHRLHVAWATRNLARERQQSIVELACSPCGPQQRGRPVSSRQRATAADRALAREVLAAPCALDPTSGATHFIDPILQDRLARVGAPGYGGNPYAAVARRWRVHYKWELYYRVDRTLELWGPSRRGWRGAECASSSSRR